MLDSTQLLLVMCAERRTQLLEILKSSNAHVLTVSSCREARRVLQTHPTVEVVIADVGHPDGNWCDILKHLVDNGIGAKLLVCPRIADERLWSEVLWRGGYDLVIEPYEATEVSRIIESAARASSHRRLTAQAG